MRKQIRWRALALRVAALAALVGASGCAETEPAADDGPVGAVAEALGATVTIQPTLEGGLSNDENFVYFTQTRGEVCGGADSVVGRVDIMTSALTEFYRACDSPTQAFSDGSKVYFVEWGGDDIRRIDPTTLVNSKVADSTGAGSHRGLRVSGTHAYWADDAGIRRVPKDGGGAVQNFVPSTGSTDTMNLVGLDTSAAYFTRQNSSTGFKPVLQRLPIVGGFPVTLGPVAEGPFTAVALDDAFIYWHRPGVGIRRMPRSGGTLTTIATTGPVVDRIAANANYVFWVERESTAADAPGVIKSYNKASGVVSVTEGGLASPNYLGLTSSQLLWREGSALRRAALPRCGDLACSDGETCGSCPGDCCAAAPP